MKRSFGGSSSELLGLWYVQDTLVVDGERGVEKRPVTIGKVIVAILILIIGLLVASGLSRVSSMGILLFSKEKWRRLLIEKILRLGLTVLVVALALVVAVNILIKNSRLLENSVSSMTLSDQHIRLTIQVGVAYGSPTRKVHELLLEIALTHELVVSGLAPACCLSGFRRQRLHLPGLYVD